MAQLNTTTEWQAGLLYGPMIISGIENDNVLTATGVRINKGMSHYRPELTFVQASSGNESYDFASLSVKNPIRMGSQSELRPFFIFGLHASQYSNPLSDGKQNGSGFHLVAGTDYYLFPSTYLRTDLFYGNGPGRQLLVSISLQYDFGGEQNAAQ